MIWRTKPQNWNICFYIRRNPVLFHCSRKMGVQTCLQAPKMEFMWTIRSSGYKTLMQFSTERNICLFFHVFVRISVGNGTKFQMITHTHTHHLLAGSVKSYLFHSLSVNFQCHRLQSLFYARSQHSACLRNVWVGLHFQTCNYRCTVLYVLYHMSKYGGGQTPE